LRYSCKLPDIKGTWSACCWKMLGPERMDTSTNFSRPLMSRTMALILMESARSVLSFGAQTIFQGDDPTDHRCDPVSEATRVCS
jgi:hypothetical protein